MNSKPIFAKHGTKQFFIDFFRLTLPPEGRLQSLAVLKVYDSATRARNSYLGASLLHYTDTDVREIGFRIALCRAMSEAGLTREARSAVRQAVWESGAKEREEARKANDFVEKWLYRQINNMWIDLFLYGNAYFPVLKAKLNSILPKGMR